MPHPLSNDLRERVVAHVEAGHSCHHAAKARDDVTMPELAKERSKAKGVKADPSTLSKFLIA